MKKMVLLCSVVCMMAALLTGCGSSGSEGSKAQEGADQSVAANDEILDAEGIEALAGSTLAGGSVLETKEAAVMLNYYYTNTDGTQESLDKLQSEIEACAESAGYVPIVNSGEGDKVYAIVADGLNGFNVVVLGETDSLKPGVQSEGSRRFALRYNVWEPLGDAADWKVASVEEQDYYEEDGEQYPCYLILLTDAE